MVVSWCCGRVQSPNDAIQKIKKKNKKQDKDSNYTTTQDWTNNGFLNTTKHPQ